MAERPLTPDEAELWRRLVATVQPAIGRLVPPPVPTMAQPTPTKGTVPVRPLPIPPPRPRSPGNTLDPSWDRQLARGEVVPDRTIDLHGDTLDRAYGRIDHALAAAIAAGDRLVLLVTGKPGGSRPGTGRGAIRAIVGDWLAASRHAGRIAAIRPAHRRHGGAGALYLILRRR